MEVTLDEALDSVVVHPETVGEMLQEKTLLNLDFVEGWYAVYDDTGVIGLFAREEDACRFRLNMINTHLNPVKSLG